MTKSSTNKTGKQLVPTGNMAVTFPGVGKLVVRGQIPQKLEGEAKFLALQDVTQELVTKYGSDIITMAGLLPERQKIPTGLEELDGVINGGIPAGSLIEIYGDEGTGKTALALHLAGRMENAVWVDVEHKWDRDYAAVFGITPATPVLTPIYMEDIYEILEQYAMRGVDMIVLDSLAAQVPMKEQTEMDATKIAGVSMVANFLSRRLMRLLNICYRTGTILVFLNQTRDRIGAMRWGEQKKTPGGHAPKHYAVLRIELARSGWYEFAEKELTRPYGMEVVATVKKSNVGPPKGRAELNLVYTHGWINDPHEVTKIKNLLLERYAAEGLIKPKKTRKGDVANTPETPGVHVTEEVE